MRLLVTGGAGYIGSVVAAQLLEAGHETAVLDNFSTGHEEAVPEGATLHRADLLNPDALARVLAEGYDAVLHFAAKSLVEESVRRPELYWNNNVVGTMNLLGAMRRTGSRRLVFSSTCAVYGQPDEVPIAEDETPLPTSPYGDSKLAVDRMIFAEARAQGLAAISLRYFNVAGASGELGEDHLPETHIVPLVLQVALGGAKQIKIFGTDYPTPDGTAIRDYIHVEDLAEAHLLALEATEPGEHKIFNLGNGRGFSVREVVEAARSVTERDIPAEEADRRAGDPPILIASNGKIRSELGWEPRKPEIETMIADAWKWHLDHPSGYRR